MTPSLSTSRLMLKPLTKTSQLQVDWLRDPEVVRYSEQRHLRHTIHTQLNYVKSFAGNSHIWAIHEVGLGDHIGNLTATHDPNNNIADIGVMIGEKAMWGRGFATEAVIGACYWLLDKNGADIRKLHGGCMKANEAMIKVFRKANFKFEAELPAAFLLDGNPIASVHYGKVQ